MISIKEFFNNPKVLGIRCRSHKEANKLCCTFSKLGYTWCNGENYIHSHFDDSDGPIIYTNRGTFFATRQKENFRGDMLIFDIENIEDFNFKNGDRVRIRGWKDLINEYGIDSCGNPKDILFTKEMVAICGREFTVSHISYNFEKDIEFVVAKEKLNFDFDITTDIIEKVYDDNSDKKIYKIASDFYGRWFDKIFREMPTFCAVHTTLGTYSFRFNEQRRNVSLYKNKRKVQLVKPVPEDTFDWMIGLGCALYREIYKGQPDTEYVKNITDEKDFYNYCVARFFEFDLKKIDILKERVKTCKREHCEFQLTKLRDESGATK